jgi:hypothetical protein
MGHKESTNKIRPTITLSESQHVTTTRQDSKFKVHRPTMLCFILTRTAIEIHERMGKVRTDLDAKREQALETFSIEQDSGTTSMMV